MALALCYPNRFDGGTLSGQGWSSGLPLSNLETRQISQVARAQQSTARVYLNKTGLAARLACLVGHNMGTSAQLRVRGWGSDPRTTLDASAMRASLDLPLAEWGHMPTRGTVTFTRASTGTYWGADGLLHTAAAHEPRMQYDRATGKCLGLLLEGSATNYLHYNRDLTQASRWGKNAAMTVAKSATGLDGVANSASRLTASSATARVWQTLTASGSYFRYGFWARRSIGVGDVRLTSNNFAGTTVIALTADWQWFEITSSPTGTVGIQIDAAGDEIEVDFGHAGDWASGWLPGSPIETASADVTRAAEQLNATPPSDLLGSLVAGGWTWIGRVYAPSPSTDTELVGINGSAGVQSELHLDQSVGYVPLLRYGSEIRRGAVAPTMGARVAFAVRCASADHNAYMNGVQFATAIGNPASASSTVTSITMSPIAGVSYVVERLTIWDEAPSNANLALVSSHTSVEPAPDYDSGWLNAWPSAWVSGTTAEQREGVRGLALADLGGSQTYAWWRIDLSDPTNPAGYVQLGRVFMGDKWTPQYGATSGATLGYRDRATSIEAADGARYFVDQNNPKTARFNLDGQTREAVMRYVLDIQRRQGSTREVLFMLDDADQTYLLETAFLGTLKQLTPPTAISANLWSASVELEELL